MKHRPETDRLTAALLTCVLAATLLAPAVAAAAPTGPAASVRAEIEQVLRTQSAAWSRGDLDAFTAVYAEDAAFLSPSGLTRGRGEVLARYRRRYPDRKAMGELTLEVLEVRPLPAAGPAVGASVVARWRLTFPAAPEKKPAEGLTLLVLHRRGGAWRIVQDASM